MCLCEWLTGCGATEGAGEDRGEMLPVLFRSGVFIPSDLYVLRSGRGALTGGGSLLHIKLATPRLAQAALFNVILWFSNSSTAYKAPREGAVKDLSFFLGLPSV